jgi:ABC-2 type transport system permease protein
MRAAMLAHQGATRFGTVSAIIAGLLGLVLAVGTLLLGLTAYPSPAAGSDVVAVAMAVWVAGRLAYAAFAGGGGTLRFELFRTLPIPRRTLANALLVVGLADPAMAVMAVAFGALIALGAGGGPGPVVAGVAGAALTLVLTGLSATLVAALVPSGSRRGRELGTLVVAVAISGVTVVGSLLPSLAAALTQGRAPVLSAVVRILPSGWAAVAVDGARRGDAVRTVLPLLGLAVLIAVVVRGWPALLARRLDGRIGAPRREHLRRSRRRILPATPTGAVVAKEVRTWIRDPLRLTFLVLGGLVGLGVAGVPAIAHGTTVMLPFAGLLTIVIAGAGGANLYGSDGLALRLVVLVPDSIRPDIRGRQAAWFLVVAPYAVVLTVLLTAVSGQGWAWPWVLAFLPALLGAALGLVPLASVTAVQTLDTAGGVSPAWPVKIYATLLLILVPSLPGTALLIVGAVSRTGWLEWLAVPVGLVVGACCAVLLGRAAERRFAARRLDVLALLTNASSPS